MTPYNIPAHTGCQNCGDCCSMIPATSHELQRIYSHLKTHPNIRTRAQQNAHKLFVCPFRDNATQRCLIYSVRPIICVLMGVCAGMECTHGNSAYIDGRPFLQDHDLEHVVILNLLDWEDL